MTRMPQGMIRKIKRYRHKKSAREEILEDLRKAYPVEFCEKPDFSSPLFHEITQPPVLVFKKNLELVNGKVTISQTEDELFSSLATILSLYKPENICCREPGILKKLYGHGIHVSECLHIPENIEAGITGCEFLVAETGSVMVSSAQQGGRQMFAFPPVHIIIAEKSQLVVHLENAYQGILKKYGSDLPSHIALITGPSRTADIEKTLVLGAHGPREVQVFLLMA